MLVRDIQYSKIDQTHTLGQGVPSDHEDIPTGPPM